MFKEGLLSRDLAAILHALRKVRNKAVHENYSSVEDGKTLMQMAYGLCEWFMMTYGDWNYQHQPFVMPQPEAAPVVVDKEAEKAKEEALVQEAEETAASAEKVESTTRRQRAQKAASQRVKSEAETRYSIDKYLDEHSVQRIRDEEYGGHGVYDERRRLAIDRERWEVEQRRMAQCRQQMGAAEETQPKPAASVFPVSSEISLKDAIGSKGDTFQQRLFKLIDASGLDDVTVYHKANIDRKVFSRIRCKPNYKPKKITAVAFAIALELDLPTTCDLLATAGIALSQSDDFDLIISYFIGKKEYDIFTINAALFEYGQPTLGAIE